MGMSMNPGAVAASGGMNANLGQSQTSSNLSSVPMSATRSGRGPGLVASDVYRGVYMCVCVCVCGRGPGLVASDVYRGVYVCVLCMRERAWIGRLGCV